MHFILRLTAQLINQNDCVKKGAQSIGNLFLSLNSIARRSLRLTDPAAVSNLEVQSARNRDRQCRCFARCSTSMTIAGNFVRSVCVLSRLSSLFYLSPSQPVLIHIAIHPPCIPLSHRSWTLHSIRRFRICKRRKSV